MQNPKRSYIYIYISCYIHKSAFDLQKVYSRDMSSDREILWEEDVSKWVLLSQGAEGVGFVLSAKRYKTSFSFSF